MNKEKLFRQVIVLMAIGLFFGSSIVPSIGGTQAATFGTSGHPVPLDTHDLAVTNISVNNPVYKNDTTPVTGRIYNAGSSDETNATVKMYFNYTAERSDGFEYYNPMPKGWTTIVNCPASTWFEYVSTYSSNYPRVQETGASGLAQDEWLISPVINCSALTTVRLYFTKYFYVTTGSDSTAQVRGSLDGGATWSKYIYNWTGTTSNSTTVNTTLSWAVGQANVKIAFRFISTADTTLSDYFYFDNFFVGQPWGWSGDNPPYGWTILDYGSESPPVWNGNDWNRYFYSNYYSYNNNVARVSSTLTPTETTQDEWLVTPTINCSGKTNITLRFGNYFYFSTAGAAYINGSIDGGTTWDKPVVKWTTSQTSPSYAEAMFYISSWAANQNNVKIRFRYYKTGTSSSYWYIDNVRVYSGSTFLLNEKFEGRGYATSFDILQNDLTDAWGLFGWEQNPVKSPCAYNQFFSVTSGSYPTCTPHGGSRMVQYYSYYAPSLAQARFSSAPLNINGLKQLKFWMYHDTGGSSSSYTKIQVQASTDGFTWTNVSTPIPRYSATAGWAQHTLDISVYSAIPNVRIGFLATADYAYNMYFDDFSVTYTDVTNSTSITRLINISSGQTQSVTYNWLPTVVGACKITVYALPVSGETIVSNNSMNRTVNILSVPKMWITPTSFTFTLEKGQLSSPQTLTIGNNGTATLTATLASNQTWLTLNSTTLQYWSVVQ